MPPTHLIVSTSGIGIAICGKLIVAVVIPRLRHPRGPTWACCHLEFQGGIGCIVLEGRLWFCAWRQLFGDSGNGVRVWLNSRWLGLLREGEKVLRGHFLITVVLLLRDLFRHLQGGTLGGSLDSWGRRSGGCGAHNGGKRRGLGLRSLPGGLSVRGAIRGFPGEGVGQEQPVSLFHSQVFRLGKQGRQASPLTGSLVSPSSGKEGRKVASEVSWHILLTWRTNIPVTCSSLKSYQPCSVWPLPAKVLQTGLDSSSLRPSTVHFSQLLYHETSPDFYLFANMIQLVNTSSFFSKSPGLSPADQWTSLNMLKVPLKHGNSLLPLDCHSESKARLWPKKTFIHPAQSSLPAQGKP